MGGAGAAFVLLIAWMVPPTTPKPPAEPAWRAAAKAQQESAVQRTDFASGIVPASVGQPGPAVIPAASVMVARPRPAPRLQADAPEQDDEQLSDDGQEPAAPAPRAITIEHRYPSADDQERRDAIRYRQGYSWASAADVEDPRECSRWRGDPGEDGCNDYLREQEDRGDRDRW